MKKQKILIHIIGLCLIVAGIILDTLQKDSSNGWCVLCVGVVLCVLTNPYKRVFVCPECGTKFENKDKITIALGRDHLLVTCPKCKKTNFCRGRYTKNTE